jgi:hypothetical protein
MLAALATLYGAAISPARADTEDAATYQVEGGKGSPKPDRPRPKPGPREGGD